MNYPNESDRSLGRPRKYKDLPANLYPKRHRTGVVYYQWRDPRDNKFHGLGTNKAEAVHHADLLNSAIRQSVVERRTERILQSTMTVNRFRSKYWQIMDKERTLAPNTVKTRTCILDKICAHLGKKALPEVTVLDCASLIDQYRVQDKDRMAQAIRSVLVDFFKVAISEGLCAGNPAAETRNPRVLVQTARWTLETFNAALAHARGPVRDAMLLGLLTGQRLDDIARMRFRDVQDGFLHVIQGKTGNRVKLALTLRLDAVGMDLSETIAQCRNNVVSQYLIHHLEHWPNAKPGDRLSLTSISRGVKVARRKTGLEWPGYKPPNFREIRSLAGRLYREEGKDAQAILGHKDARTTSIYLDTRGHDWIIAR